MGAVVMAVGKGNPGFVSLAFINIVVAANAGGAFSPLRIKIPPNFLTYCA
jgi:Na+/H+ antiporter NhaD/arsenite permease-like protein